MNPRMLHLQVVGAAGLGSMLTIVFGPEASIAAVQHQVVTLALMLIGRPLEDLIALAMLLLAALIPLQQWLRWEH